MKRKRSLPPKLSLTVLELLAFVPRDDDPLEQLEQNVSFQCLVFFPCKKQNQLPILKSLRPITISYHLSNKI